MSENLKNYETKSGRKIVIDISDKAIKCVCKKYSNEILQHDNTIFHPLFGYGKVIGVAEGLLWFIFRKDEERKLVSKFHTRVKVQKV